MTSEVNELLGIANQKVEERERKFHTAVMIVVLVAAAFSVTTLSLMTLTWIRVEQVAELENTEREQVLDCTVPGGECYAESAARTEEAVNRIIESIAKDHEELLDSILAGRGQGEQHGKE